MLELMTKKILKVVVSIYNAKPLDIISEETLNHYRSRFDIEGPVQQHI